MYLHMTTMQHTNRMTLMIMIPQWYNPDVGIIIHTLRSGDACMCHELVYISSGHSLSPVLRQVITLLPQLMLIRPLGTNLKFE